jgi:N-hydroxyarylamine O-acetyltransferase
MSIRHSNQYLCERLLRVLGVQRQKPSIEALTEVVRAFAMRVPFENVSKLYYKARYGLRGLPDSEMYVDGIERYNFGGTCYPNNYHLHLLLAHLGYDVKLCGADMADPDVHLVNIASLDGREYLVDAGYAAPFLAPLPRDLDEDYEISLGRERYVLNHQDGNGISRLDLYRDGELTHGYTINPIPRKIDHFTDVIRDSFRDSATFMNSLLLVRLYPDRSTVIRNLSIIESKGSEYHVRRLSGKDEVPAAVEQYFSIPREIVSEAVAEVAHLGDPWI